MLEREGLRQINQRVTARFHLRPFSLRETSDYIRHRVAVAGVDRPLFSAGAVKRIHRVSGGVPRVINILCDRALLGACVTRANQVTPAIVAKAAREVQGERMEAKTPPPAVRPVFAAAAAATLLLVAGWLSYGSMSGAGPDHPLAGLLDRGSAADASAADPGTEPTGDHPGASDRSRLADGGSKAGSVVDSAEEPVLDPGPDAIGDTVAAGPSSAEGDEELPPAPASDGNSAPPLDAAGDAVAAGSGSAAGASSPGPESDGAALPRVSLASFAPEAAPETLARLAMPEATALRVLLRRWGVMIQDLGGGDPCIRVAVLGLRCERERGKLSNVRYFDRPALLRVSDQDGEPRYAALGSLDLDHATLDLETGPELVPLEGLQSVWTGEYTLIWQPPPTGASLIAPGASPDSVLWLRRLIAKVPDNGLANVDSGEFDADLRAALKDFQRSRGLAADGIAGPRTLMQLHNAAGTSGIPRLMPAAVLEATAAMSGAGALAKVPGSAQSADAP
jgi:general secretion pathway protein A